MLVSTLITPLTGYRPSFACKVEAQLAQIVEVRATDPRYSGDLLSSHNPRFLANLPHVLCANTTGKNLRLCRYHLLLLFLVQEFHGPSRGLDYVRTCVRAHILAQVACRERSYSRPRLPH